MKRIIHSSIIGFFYFAFISCNNILTLPEYYGSWYLKYNPSTKYVFYEGGKFEFLINDSISLFEKQTSKFNFNIVNDTCWLTLKYKFYSIEDKQIRQYLHRVAIKPMDEYITFISYKSGEEIRNHIDEYGIWIKDVQNPLKIDFPGKKIIYILPKDFCGKVWIAFNQPDGLPPVYDGMGNAILNISESGKLLTSLREDAFGTANKQYIICYANDDKRFINIQVFDKFEKMDSSNIKTDNIYAFMDGFNQRPREHINMNIFGTPIKGNVMLFFIGTYKDWKNEDKIQKEL